MRTYVEGMNITPGEHVSVVNARGERSIRVALTGVTAGRDFDVVWICNIDEYESAAREGREPEGVPWPAEDVQAAAMA